MVAILGVIAFSHSFTPCIANQIVPSCFQIVAECSNIVAPQSFNYIPRLPLMAQVSQGGSGTSRVAGATACRRHGLARLACWARRARPGSHG